MGDSEENYGGRLCEGMFYTSVGKFPARFFRLRGDRGFAFYSLLGRARSLLDVSNTTTFMRSPVLDVYTWRVIQLRI